MSTLSTTRRMILAYAEFEPWREDHDRAMICRDVEELLAWGICSFQTLGDLEARLQARAFRREMSPEDGVWEDIKELYRCWIAASEKILLLAIEVEREGFELEMLSAFRAALEEARCLPDLWEFEPELLPIEEALRRVKPGNPRPDCCNDRDEDA